MNSCVCCVCVLDNLILTDDVFAKSLQKRTICLSDSNDLFKKSTSSLELSIIFDNNLVVVPGHFLLLIEIFKLQIS